MMKTRSAVILSSSSLIRKGLRALLEERQLCSVVLEAVSLSELPAMLENNYPELLFADLVQLDEQGYSRLKELPCPSLESMTLIAITEGNTTQLPLHFNASIDKNSDTDVLLKDITALLPAEVTVQSGREDQLSDREINVLGEIVLGLTNKEVGDKLFISPHTVITHRKNITRKIGIRTLSGLTVYAIMNGIVSMEDIQSADNHDDNETNN